MLDCTCRTAGLEANRHAGNRHARWVIGQGLTSSILVQHPGLLPGYIQRHELALHCSPYTPVQHRTKQFLQPQRSEHYAIRSCFLVHEERLGYGTQG